VRVIGLKHLAAILLVNTGGAAMKDIYQTKKLWAALSPRLARASPNRLSSDDAGPDSQEQSDQDPGCDGNARYHPVLLIPHPSSDQRDSP
jgi:hypothetical protein